MNIKIAEFLWGILFFISYTFFAQGTPKVSIRNLKISAFPVVFYTPETAFGFGGLGSATFRLKNEPMNSRPSFTKIGISYTTKNQFLVYIPFEFYKNEEHWRINGELGFYKYCCNFYGIGVASKVTDGETYAVTFPKARFSLFREVFSNFLVGMGHELDVFGSLKIKEGGILESSNVNGKRNGTDADIEILAIYDTRDNTFFPTEGFYI